MTHAVGEVKELGPFSAEVQEGLARIEAETKACELADELADLQDEFSSSLRDLDEMSRSLLEMYCARLKRTQRQAESDHGIESFEATSAAIKRSVLVTQYHRHTDHIESVGFKQFVADELTSGWDED